MILTVASSRTFPGDTQKKGNGKPVTGKRANSHPVLRREAGEGGRQWGSNLESQEEKRTRRKEQARDDRCHLVTKSHTATDDSAQNVGMCNCLLYYCFPL